MRDINRIERITNKIKEIWGYVPDWRFMQLMSNFFAQSDRINFYLEDDTFEERIDFVLDQLQNKNKM